MRAPVTVITDNDVDVRGKSNRDRRKTSILGVTMLRVVLVGGMLTCASLLLGQANAQALANVTVTVTPLKVTLFAGETQTFVASVVGAGDKSVSWSVEEEDGGTITDSGLYTAPKIQGVYHITATSRGKSQAKAVATITVLSYCDPMPPAFRR